MFQKLSQKVIHFLNKKNNTSIHADIEFNKAGITIISSYPNQQKTQLSIDWENIKNIFVYKQDLYTIDRICMLIEVTSNKAIEINESASGWNNLVMNLNSYLPSALVFEEWFLKVAFPAFEINPIKIHSLIEKKV